MVKEEVEAGQRTVDGSWMKLMTQEIDFAPT